jgi:hypothetical protein
MSLERPLHTRFILERDEFSKASRLALRSLPPKIKWAGYAQLGLLIALMLIGVAYKPGGKMEPVSLVILILAWLVLLTGQITRRALTEIQFRPMEGKEIWYEFQENGFRSGSLNGESQFSWPAVSAFVETEALFVIVRSGALFHTIPKRALAAENIASLRQLLGAKVAAQG